MSFRDQPFSSRFAQMGDMAEKAFELVETLPYVRYGLDRPPFSVGALPTQIANSPDYLQKHRFVECQGCGRDGVIKLKHVKFLDLISWSTIHPVDMFFYDSNLKRYTYATLNDALVADATIASFHEGNEYYELPIARFEWTDMP